VGVIVYFAVRVAPGGEKLRRTPSGGCLHCRDVAEAQPQLQQGECAFNKNTVGNFVEIKKKVKSLWQKI